ncbi:acyl-CoA dehydrogenase family protein [Paenibacillus puerhi]|uniref:acyl-CoA dehydrogenase family protein n=1 Tax=Paenibacillus puerhi TaxID=2692622 RepID=UPI001356FE08|nr:acyl-CoA dehydrogenase family protein [Paenibacillus puerhi]
MSGLTAVQEWREIAGEMKLAMAGRAAHADATSRFPHENFTELAQKGLHTLTLGEAYGGHSIGFENTFELISELAAGCGSTALCLAMHYYTLAGLGTMTDNAMLAGVFRDIQHNGEYMSSFNQPNVMLLTARVAPKDMVKIEVRRTNGGYIVNGRKAFVSGCERFKYLPIYGYQEDTGTRLGMTALMVTRDDSGVTIDEAWRSTAMKGTKSHHVTLDEVFIPEDRLIGREGHAIEDTNELSHWSRLAISSVYQGIAQAAFDHVVSVLGKKRDMYSQTPLAFMPGSQFTLAEMRIKLETAANQLRMFARRADREREQGRFTDDLFQQSLITKYYVTHMANEIVWQAMQLDGMSALNEGELLERLYRDVRAATYHQPGDDLLKELLAKKTLGVVSVKNRWC